MYVDDLMAISQDVLSVIRVVAEKFELKKGEIEPPDISLGGKLAEKELNVSQVWTMSICRFILYIGSDNKKITYRVCGICKQCPSYILYQATING